jgi:hypothetical protein
VGPITSTSIAALPRRRWLVLLVVPLAIGVVIEKIRELPPEPTAAEAGVGLELDRIARAHRLWVADHGPGCARTVGHLAPYDEGASAPDEWGQPLHFTCQRMDAGRLIAVWVVSSGEDRELGTSDDLTGMDVQDAPRFE